MSGLQSGPHCHGFIEEEAKAQRGEASPQWGRGSHPRARDSTPVSLLPCWFVVLFAGRGDEQQEGLEEGGLPPLKTLCD